MLTKLLHFPRWAEVLENSSIPSKIKKHYQITLLWYLGWCRKRAIGSSVDSARAFVKWAQQEKSANDWQVEQWKEAVQWYSVEGLSRVYLPEALARKYRNAGKDWQWQWVWPSREFSTDPRSGLKRRHHIL